MEHPDQVKPPEDLAGYQHIHYGFVQEGDIIVSGTDRLKEWADLFVGMNVEKCSRDYSSDVYRKMECPKHEGQIKLEHGVNMPGWKESAHGELKWINEKAKTDDGGKPPLATIPWKAIREVAMVQAYGQKKYGDFYNYKKGMEVTRQLGCSMRHMADYLDGIDLDSESGRHHLAHAACRILFTLETILEKTAIDDRYKK